MATGGFVTAYDPWLPTDEELVETRYTWKPQRPTT